MIIKTKRIAISLACLLCMFLLVGAAKDEVASVSDEITTVEEMPAATDSAAAQDLPAAEMEENSAEEEELPPVQPEVPAEPAFLTVDGTPVEIHYTLHEGETTYVSVVDFVEAVAPEGTVTWTGNGVEVKTDKLTMTAVLGQKYVVANDRYLYVEDGVMLYEDATMLPAAVLAKAFDATLVWHVETATIDIFSGSGALESGETFYAEDAVYWLSHIINAESGNQPLAGKIAVGNVIMNRVESPLFPNTIYTVIFQRNQFSPASSGAIYRDANQESVIAAKLVLDGAEVLDNALYFNRVGMDCWASRNKTLVATIGAHAFYA